MIVSKKRAAELQLLGVEQLQVDEVSRLTGVAESYLTKYTRVGYLQLDKVASSKWVAVDRHRMRHVSAREAFDQFWRSRKGAKRLLSDVCRAEVETKAKGYPLGYMSPAQDQAMDKYLANVDALAEKRGGVVTLTEDFRREAEAMP